MKSQEAKTVLGNEAQRFKDKYRATRSSRIKAEANLLLEIHLKELGLDFIPEFQFHDSRKWRFDYLLLANRLTNLSDIGVEIEGGIWTNGRHNRAKGYQNDLEKYREATRLGYKVYRFSTQEVLNGTAREFLQGEVNGKSKMSVPDHVKKSSSLR